MEGLSYALQAVTTMPVVAAAFGGVLWGILGGALPGISPSIAMALLLPFTYNLPPLVAVVLLASVYVGAEYGGSIPAILIRTPGTNAAAATTIDGYAMHMKGRGGEALGLSLVGGTIGGLFGLILLATLTEPLSSLALLFTPPAYFAMGILGISVIASLSEGALLKGLIAGVLGMMIATVGTDPISGVSRFTFGNPNLLEGIHFILIMLGIFAVSELMVQAGENRWREGAKPDTGRAKLKLPTLPTLWRLRRAQGIGCVLGAVEGAIPGAGGSVAAFLSYNEARRWSKEPEKFGHGSEEGVIAPETANNVVSATALVPTLSFGIPGSNSTAILLGGFLIHGLQPGPLLFTSNPEIVYGLFGGLFTANLMMLLLGIVILGPCIWLVKRPKPYLMAAIFGLVVSGVYSIDHSLFDLWVVLAAGVVGYIMRVLGFPHLPLILGLVLGYMIESNYRRALLMTNGDHIVFLQDGVSLTLLTCAALIIGVAAVREIRRWRKPLVIPASQAH
ncbi:tripartite tricarboxylate transporter permease [Microvirga roseola]|uniref:tripartite tricarboxylate transporter permease n=1 Tax=Microvirga roseola TaxID=2883126 RepID=UPI001E513478|nr:tripartite tricarboxylate transporter permease [Microvirga roseola]